MVTEEIDSNEDQRPQPGEGCYMNRDNEDPNLRCNSGNEHKVPNLRNTQKVKYVRDITGFQLTAISNSLPSLLQLTRRARNAS